MIPRLESAKKWFVPPSSYVVSALAADDAHPDVRAWTDLLTLPSLLPVAFVRGRRGNTRGRENEQRRTVPKLAGLPACRVVTYLA